MFRLSVRDGRISRSFRSVRPFVCLSAFLSFVLSFALSSFQPWLFGWLLGPFVRPYFYISACPTNLEMEWWNDFKMSPRVPLHDTWAGLGAISTPKLRGECSSKLKPPKIYWLCLPAILVAKLPMLTHVIFLISRFKAILLTHLFDGGLDESNCVRDRSVLIRNNFIPGLISLNLVEGSSSRHRWLQEIGWLGGVDSSLDLHDPTQPNHEFSITAYEKLEVRGRFLCFSRISSQAVRNKPKSGGTNGRHKLGWVGRHRQATETERERANDF